MAIELLDRLFILAHLLLAQLFGSFKVLMKGAEVSLTSLDFSLSSLNILFKRAKLLSVKSEPAVDNYLPVANNAARAGVLLVFGEGSFT